MNTVHELERSRTKSGPGRMPHNRAAGISGAKLWRQCPIKRPDDPEFAERYKNKYLDPGQFAGGNMWLE